MQKVGLCLTDTDLNSYLSGTLSPEKKRDAEGHLASCSGCLEKVVFAYQTVKEFNKTKQKGEKVVKSRWRKNLWLLGAIITFTLSFLVPRYFVQLLVATILMAVKWIFDSVNARILIMIYDAWKHGGNEEASKILHKLNNRF